MDMSIEDRKVIYQARRGLKELDFYLDPYVRAHYLTAAPQEKALFQQLLTFEDPDLLAWFLEQETPPNEALAELIETIKSHRF